MGKREKKLLYLCLFAGILVIIFSITYSTSPKSAMTMYFITLAYIFYICIYTTGFMHSKDIVRLSALYCVILYALYRITVTVIRVNVNVKYGYLTSSSGIMNYYDIDRFAVLSIFSLFFLQMAIIILVRKHINDLKGFITTVLVCILPVAAVYTAESVWDIKRADIINNFNMTCCEFTKEKWEKYPQKRTYMLNDFINKNNINGMEEKKLRELLGQPDKYSDNQYIYIIDDKVLTTPRYVITISDGVVESTAVMPVTYKLKE